MKFSMLSPILYSVVKWTTICWDGVRTWWVYGIPAGTKVRDRALDVISTLFFIYHILPSILKDRL